MDMERNTHAHIDSYIHVLERRCNALPLASWPNIIVNDSDAHPYTQIHGYTDTPTHVNMERNTHAHIDACTYF